MLGAGLANWLSGRARLAPVIMGSICLQALPFALTVLVHSPALACFLQVVSGVGMVIVDVLAITTLQRDLPGEVLSRVLGVFDTVMLAGILLASLATGILLAHAERGRRADRRRRRDSGPRPAGPAHPAASRPHGGGAAERLRPWVELLSELDLLAGADRSTLERLAAAAEEVVLRGWKVVIREGDEADALWILMRGELSVAAHGDGPQEPRCRR